MGLRKVTFKTEGLEVVSIRWRAPLSHDFIGYNEVVKKEPCVYCGGLAKTWDHLIPKSKGGPSGWTNMARACSHCNLKRDTKPFLIFMIQQQQLRTNP